MSEPKTETDAMWRVAARTGAELGERPIWDERGSELVWVDIEAGELHRLGTGGDRVAFGVAGTLGAAGLRRDGGYVLAADDSFVLTDAAGAEEDRIVPGAMPAGVRFNDGVCDAAGRFWAGTAALDGTPGAGSLYRLGPTGEIETVFEGISESNGLGWSPDGETFYFVDSGEATPRVRAFDFDPDSAEVGPARDLTVFSAGEGVPDGLTVDADGCVWVAMWGGWSVLGIAPDGERVATLRLPVSQPTCPGFGGTALQDLFVTTAWEGMDRAGRESEPLAGSVFAATTGHKGIATARFGG